MELIKKFYIKALDTPMPDFIEEEVSAGWELSAFLEEDRTRIHLFAGKQKFLVLDANTVFLKEDIVKVKKMFDDEEFKEKVRNLLLALVKRGL